MYLFTSDPYNCVHVAKARLSRNKREAVDAKIKYSASVFFVKRQCNLVVGIYFDT